MAKFDVRYDGLNRPLPSPPLVTLGGVECILQKVKLHELDEWQNEHQVRWVRNTFMGKFGHVSVFHPIAWATYTQEEGNEKRDQVPGDGQDNGTDPSDRGDSDPGPE